MEVCYKCGISEEKAGLFDVILIEGVSKICRNCSSKEDIPIIKKPNVFKIKESQKKQTVYDRISKISGVSRKQDIPKQEKELLEKQETTLKDIIDRNFRANFKHEKKSKDDLIKNFHWIIMRARRARKLTQEQLAKAIGEPDLAIKMAEKGIISEDNYKIIKKIENYLRIRLLKKEVIEELNKQSKEIVFDEDTKKTLTIEDLQRMKEEREAKILGDLKEDLPKDETDDLISSKD
ncbi:hypothetical protein CMI40_02670 [Candidatus Pacearchaeota archaeon]|jgi:ribosome-binding protein aMBF1 (putative translation factor)|nr:hypothetical protein [Candidatus Pacearchaeota archaeon]|tara:strand:+ start:4188 stop:4892 length:705 start_codon:yes stop_codon:yes gene_type:complete